MEILAFVKFIPVVLSVVEAIKRFIPNKKREWANPVLAVVTGLLAAYSFGGTAEIIELLIQGLLAAAGAIGAYKIPKVIGAKLNIE